MNHENELRLAGMDLPDLLRRLMGNEKLVGLFVKKFLEDGNYLQLQTAVARGDWAAAEHASHTLKGMCGNLSLKELFGLFDRQVRHLRAGETQQAAGMMTEITAAFEASAGHLKAWLAAQ